MDMIGLQMTLDNLAFSLSCQFMEYLNQIAAQLTK
jgi:hypothetical protein